MFTVYATRSSFATLRGVYPRFRHQPYWIPITRIAIVYVGYLIGDYLGTSPMRKGGNDQFSHLLKNNDFIFTREAFA